MREMQNQKHEIQLNTHYDGYYFLKWRTKSIGENMEKLELCALLVGM